ncbi:F-box/LRR-repeat protein [Trifolium pratense]|uniref:F-box/LRR-repeat protein n=1 Tax=Trifolium pratense TaxID=57577 RepID=A0A2K3NF76_TRIPR|nr:F-box/LRR-repeat protein [Trifolium pratense]
MKRQRSSCSESNLDLADDCWELVFRFLNEDEDCHRHLKSLSVVSKQLLSITNRLRFSLKICYQTLPFLPRLFQRFTKLTSLDLTCFHGDLNALLYQISCFRFNHLTSLNLSNQPTIPADGLRAFSQSSSSSITTLICSRIKILYGSDLHVIADCFPLLEELDLSHPSTIRMHDYNNLLNGIETLSVSLVKLRKINLSSHPYINDQLLYHLFKNCKHLKEAIMLSSYQLTVAGITSALSQRPTLTSLSLSPFSSYIDKLSVTSHFIDSLVGFKGLTCLHLWRWHVPDNLLSSIAMESPPLRRLVLQSCTGYTYSGLFNLLSKCRRLLHLGIRNANFLCDHHVAELSSLFLAHLVSIDLSSCLMLTESSLIALNRNCPSLAKIIMEFSHVLYSNSSMDSVVNPQLKYLSLAHNFCLENHNIIKLASIFSNLHLLDLSACISISEEGIGQLLSRCCNIRELNLADCPNVKSLGINFEVPKLEVLNLTMTIVDDEALCVISKRCPGLLQLLLTNCKNITDNGVMQVVKNCTQLREINLQLCHQVHAKVIDSMVFLRPSLRKITAPPDFPLSDKYRKHFLRHGCLLEH